MAQRQFRLGLICSYGLPMQPAVLLCHVTHSRDLRPLRALPVPAVLCSGPPMWHARGAAQCSSDVTPCPSVRHGRSRPSPRLPRSRPRGGQGWVCRVAGCRGRRGRPWRGRAGPVLPPESSAAPPVRPQARHSPRPPPAPAPHPPTHTQRQAHATHPPERSDEAQGRWRGGAHRGLRGDLP